MDEISVSPNLKAAMGNERLSAIFNLDALIATLPDQADTMLVDVRLTDEPAASARVFRIYSPVPAHFHRTCDEYLLVLSGRARIAVEGVSASSLGSGELLFFKRGTVHSFPEILEHPLVVLAVDAPRREPKDVTFVEEPEAGADVFIRTLPSY